MIAGQDTSSMLSYKPSVFYFRTALRDAKDLESAKEAGLLVCAELDELKAWIRECGMTPPHFNATTAEAKAKGWALEEAQAAPALVFETCSG